MGDGARCIRVVYSCGARYRAIVHATIAETIDSVTFSRDYTVVVGSTLQQHILGRVYKTLGPEHATRRRSQRVLTGRVA